MIKFKKEVRILFK